MAEKKWYVVRAIGGQEKKVCTYIENEISRLNLEEFISQVLVPTEKVYQIRNGKKVSKDRNFFPGYVLIEANLVGEIPHTIKAIPGVIGFLGATKGGEPLPMRQSEVNRILGKVDELAVSDEEIVMRHQNNLQTIPICNKLIKFSNTGTYKEMLPKLAYDIWYEIAIFKKRYLQ